MRVCAASVACCLPACLLHLLPAAWLALPVSIASQVLRSRAEIYSSTSASVYASVLASASASASAYGMHMQHAHAHAHAER